MLAQLEKIILNNGSKEAIRVSGNSYSYADLASEAIAVKQYVLNQSDTVFGVYTDNNFETYSALLGITLAGKTFVPINHKFPITRLEKIVHNLNIDKVLCSEQSVEPVSNLGTEAIVVGHLKQSTTGSQPIAYKGESTLYILFTSGSTGEPKGIPISYNNFSNLLNNVFDSLPMKSSDRVLQTFELSFDVSLACTFMAWTSGATLVLSPLDGIISVNAFKTIVDEQTNWVCLAPSSIPYLKKLKLLKEYPCPFITTTVFTGEALPNDHIENWKNCAQNSKIYNAYGPTENTVWSFVHEVSKDTQVENGLAPIGQPINGFQYQLKKDELWVSGDQVFNGYVNNLEKTKSVLVRDSGNIWYKTGDIVKIQSDGNSMYVNRKDNQVQINGYRVELGEVEFKIRNQLNVPNCCVLFEKDKNSLTAFIERKEGVSLDEKKELNTILPFYMQPRRYISLTTFPLNNSSKIDRKSLETLL